MNSIENISLRKHSENNKIKIDGKSTSSMKSKSKMLRIDEFKENHMSASASSVSQQRFQKHRDTESYLNKIYIKNKHPEYSDLKEMASKIEKSIAFLHEWFEIKRAMSVKNGSNKF